MFVMSSAMVISSWRMSGLILHDASWRRKDVRPPSDLARRSARARREPRGGRRGPAGGLPTEDLTATLLPLLLEAAEGVLLRGVGVEERGRAADARVKVASSAESLEMPLSVSSWAVVSVPAMVSCGRGEEASAPPPGAMAGAVLATAPLP